MQEPIQLTQAEGRSIRLWRRGRLSAFVDRHRLAWDLVMAVLTLVYVVLAFREDSSTRLDDFAVWGLAVIFLVEFGARFYDSSNRHHYLRTHWLDLITAVPVPGIPGLRVIRLLRLLRFLKIGLYLRRLLLGRGWTETGLMWPTLVLFWIASALALWLVEHDAPGSGITTFGEAMTAAFLSAATLGFGKHALPVTQDGQIISAVIVFFALGLWGFASSRITQMWLQPQKEEMRGQYTHLHQDIAAIRQQLQLLTDAVAESKGVAVHSKTKEAAIPKESVSATSAAGPMLALDSRAAVEPP